MNPFVGIVTGIEKFLGPKPEASFVDPIAHEVVTSRPLDLDVSLRIVADAVITMGNDTQTIGKTAESHKSLLNGFVEKPAPVGNIRNDHRETAPLAVTSIIDRTLEARDAVNRAKPATSEKFNARFEDGSDLVLAA